MTARPVPQLGSLRTESADFLTSDLLRFFAAVAIVFFHLHASLGVPKAPTRGLSIFVDVFFILSGVIICHVYGGKITSGLAYWRFLKARIARLVPLHWLLTFAYGALGALALAAGLELNTPEKYDWSCFLPSLLLIHAFGTCDGLAFNFVSWSISAEMGMYILFPLLWIIAVRARWAALIAVVGYAVYAATSIDNFYLRNADWGLLRALLGFSFGMVLYLFRDELTAVSRPLLPQSPILRDGIGLGLIALIFVLTLTFERPVAFFLIYAATTAIVCVDFAKAAGPRVAMFSPLGQLTYSIYMLHPIFQTIYLTVIGDRILKLEGPLALTYGYIGLVILFGVSWLSLIFFEAPMRRWVRDLGRKKQQQDNVET